MTQSTSNLGDGISSERHSGRKHHHHPAIDGLRAVAVLLVVLNHADVPGFTRGFIGVDMFFALSGFLITDRIVRSWDGGSTVGLVTFWAGRARRLLPAMAVVITATCLACAAVLAPQELTRIAGYGLAADMFNVNNLIAFRGGNYFAGPLRELPFLHLWSLAVEEQFYLFWPVALGPGARWIARRTRRAYRSVIAAGLGIAVLTSLLASILLTKSDPLWAFYSLPTRVYEFALGAAAALFWQDRFASPARRTVYFAVGVAAIVSGLVATPVGYGFPAAWPLLAAGGTVLVILGTERDGVTPVSAFTRILGSTPFRFVGRYSYGWYLWHWPALLLGTAASSATVGRVASVASLVAAVLSFHLVEQRFRYLPSLVRSNGRSLVAGGLALAVGALACAGLAGFAKVRLRDPFIQDLIRAEESFVIAGCTPDTAAVGAEVCLGGSDDPASPIVLLVGDSHAAQWTAAFAAAGRAEGFRVATRTLGNCSSFVLLTTNPNPAVDDECLRYQRESLALARDDRVSAVVFAEALTSRRTHGEPEQWYRAAVHEIDRIDRPKGVIVDSPAFNEPLQCLSRGNTVDECRVTSDEAFAMLRDYQAEESNLKGKGVHLLDLGEVMCPSDPCPLKSGGIWIAARAAHLNRDFTLAQVEPISRFVSGLLVES